MRREKQVFLLRRFNTGYQDGNYTLPAGHVDADESAIAAAIRETEEEAGVKVKKEDLMLVHTLHRNSKDRVYIDLYFEVKEWDGEAMLCEKNKSDECIWSNVKSLPDNVIPDVREVILLVEKGVGYSDYNF